MGLLDRAIKNGISKGISKGIGDALGKAVEKAVNPAAERLAGKAAAQLDEASAAMGASAQSTANAVERVESAGGFAALETALNGWAKDAEQYATELSKNLKVCPNCGEPAAADQKFCPKCGAKLPEETMAQGAICPNCGKQNVIGTAFCSECGTKLPAAEAAEKAVLADWAVKLPQYPVWSCGGTSPRLEVNEDYVMFTAVLESDAAAQNAVNQYREALLAAGFKQAGEYPSKEHLYKKVGGSCYHVDTEHCLDGDSNAPTLYFNVEEPVGGYDYVKPAAQQKGFGLKDGLDDFKEGLGDLKEGLGGLKGLFKR